MSFNAGSKIFSNTLYDRLLAHVESVTENYRSGIRAGRSTANQIQTIRQILEKTRQHNIGTFHIFIDFNAAYDSIRRDNLLMDIDAELKYKTVY
jgi:sorting nexin-29